MICVCFQPNSRSNRRKSVVNLPPPKPVKVIESPEHQAVSPPMRNYPKAGPKQGSIRQNLHKRATVINIPPQHDESAVDDIHHNSMDVLALMGELKKELRVETERMNSKMGVVEAQMRIILKLLRKQKNNAVDVESGIRLEELMQDRENQDSRDNRENTNSTATKASPKLPKKKKQANVSFEDQKPPPKAADPKKSSKSSSKKDTPAKEKSPSPKNPDKGKENVSFEPDSGPTGNDDLDDLLETIQL